MGMHDVLKNKNITMININSLVLVGCEWFFKENKTKTQKKALNDREMLAKKKKKNGLNNPIVVFEQDRFVKDGEKIHKKKQFIITDGRHRYLAIKNYLNFKYKAIPCVVWKA